MEKLELKHLENYLSSKIKVYDTIRKKTKIMNLGQGGSSNWIGIKTVLNYSGIYKPILRPLSDLTQHFYFELSGKDPKNSFPVFFIKGDGKTKDRFHFTGYSSKQINIVDYKQCPYWFIDFLFKNKFDLFGLIEKALAVDINTIKQ